MNVSEYRICYLALSGVFLLSACTGTGTVNTTPTQPITQPEATLTSSPTPPPTITSTPTATPQPTRTREPTSTLPPDIEPLVGENWGIYLVEPDGENLQRLTEVGKNYQHPQFSPDGTQVAFVGGESEDTESLMVYRLDSQETETLFEVGGIIKDYAWAPSSSQIAVLVQAEENVAYLSIFDFENGSLEDLLEWDGGLASVSWSYDGRYLAFAGSEPTFDFTPSMNERGKTEVYIFDTGDDQLTQLTSTGGLAFAPEWSPTEYALVYLEREYADFGGKLYLHYPLEPDKAPLEITNVPSLWLPSFIWSPDGEKIAYGGEISAAVVGVYDPSYHRALMFGAGNYFPTSWSPDSKFVTAETGGCCLRYITLINMGKTEVDDVVNELYHAWGRLLGSKIESNQFWLIEAQWSPVENLIVFAGLWNPPIP